MANHLLFEFYGTRYAIAAEAVQTTFWLPELSPVEDLPPYFAGLINLHGEVIPIIDLGLRFGHLPRGYRLDQAVVLLRHQQRQMGVIVDAVLDLVNLPPSAVEPYVELEGLRSHQAPSVIAGTVKWESAVLILLDLMALMQLVSQGNAEFWGGGGVGGNADNPAESNRFGALSPQELERLRRRTRQLAQSPEKAGQSDHWYALVTIGTGRYALELDRVAEFTHLSVPTPIPCCPPHILGCMNLRGAILTLVDLAPFLQGQPRRDYREVVVVLLGEHLLGLAVHQVDDVRAYPIQAGTPLLGQAYGHPHCKLLLHDGSGVSGVLDLDALHDQGALEVKEKV